MTNHERPHGQSSRHESTYDRAGSSSRYQGNMEVFYQGGQSSRGERSVRQAPFSVITSLPDTEQAGGSRSRLVGKEEHKEKSGYYQKFKCLLNLNLRRLRDYDIIEVTEVLTIALEDEADRLLRDSNNFRGKERENMLKRQRDKSGLAGNGRKKLVNLRANKDRKEQKEERENFLGMLSEAGVEFDKEGMLLSDDIQERQDDGRGIEVYPGSR